MKDIPGFSKYTVNEQGEVRTNGLRPGIMVPSVDRNGYIRHRLVAAVSQVVRAVTWREA